MSQANLNDPSSVKAALKGAYGVFAVTNYWESGKSEVEIAQGKSIADAAKVGDSTIFSHQKYMYLTCGTGKRSPAPYLEFSLERHRIDQGRSHRGEAL